MGKINYKLGYEAELLYEECYQGLREMRERKGLKANRRTIKDLMKDFGSFVQQYAERNGYYK